MPLPRALHHLIARGVVPPTLLLVGVNDDAQALVTDLQTPLSVAPADTLQLSEVPAIAELRRVLARLTLTPHQSPRLLLVIHGLERWSEELSTVLLKTLEEPPPHATIALLATDDTAVLPTILSRVARFQLVSSNPPVSAESILPLEGSLHEQFDWSQAQSDDHTPLELLQRALPTLPLPKQQVVLERLTEIGSHPVNKRLALDATLVRLAERILNDH